MNGEVTTSGRTTFGYNATLSCNAGYTLFGDSSVTCEVGGWSGTANCTAVGEYFYENIINDRHFER